MGLDIHSGKEVWQASGEHVGELPHPCFWADGVLMITNENGYAGIPTSGRGKRWTVAAGGWSSRGRSRFVGFSGIGISGYLHVDRLVWIKDRRPGHLTKVRGVLKALGYFYDLRVTEREVKWRPGFLRGWVNLLGSLGQRLPLSICLDAADIARADLVISAGGQTETRHRPIGPVRGDRTGGRPTGSGAGCD